MKEPLRPAALRPGDLVALVSPAGPARAERVARGVDLLTSWGLKVRRSPHALARIGYLAGADADRLSDLNLALCDGQVRAVVCTRGGYGVQRIVDRLNMAAVRADPKVVVGFSDLTALHLALWRGARLATVYGPGAAWFDQRTGPDAAEALRRAVMTTDPVVVPARSDEETSPLRLNGVGGPVTGTLLGGNLCLLSSSVGTVDMPDLRGGILLVEDVGESPYKVDRMLVHLRRAGALIGLAGVAVGQFTHRATDADSLLDVLDEHLGALGIPVLGGLPLGHGRDQLSIPLGVPATLDVAAGTLTAAAAVREPA